MNLREIEEYLADERKERGLKYGSFRKRGIRAETVMMIEKGGNYKVSSLLKLIHCFNLVLWIGEREINDVSQLGLLYYGFRTAVNYPRVEVAKKTGISMKAMNTFERGHDCTRVTLVAYNKFVNTDFTLMPLMINHTTEEENGQEQ